MGALNNCGILGQAPSTREEQGFVRYGNCAALIVSEKSLPMGTLPYGVKTQQLMVSAYGINSKLWTISSKIGWLVPAFFDNVPNVIKYWSLPINIRYWL